MLKWAAGLLAALFLVSCVTPAEPVASPARGPLGAAGPASAVFTLAPSAARSTAFTGGAVDVRGYRLFFLHLDVTAVSGTTPTLDVKVQTSIDSTTWCDIGAFAQVIAVADRVMRVATDVFPLAAEDEEACTDGTLTAALVRHGPAGRYLRVKHATPGGTATPTFTFSVTAWGSE